MGKIQQQKASTVAGIESKKSALQMQTQNRNRMERGTRHFFLSKPIPSRRPHLQNAPEQCHQLGPCFKISELVSDIVIQTIITKNYNSVILHLCSTNTSLAVLLSIAQEFKTGKKGRR